MPESKTITRITVRGKLADPSLWYRQGREIHLGCSECIERDLCGGLSIGAPVHNCLDLCCDNQESCTQYACPLNPRRFSTLVNEVGGLELRPYTKPVALTPVLPRYIPSMLDSGSLAGPLHIPVVAIPLYSVLDASTGLGRFESRQELLAAFRVYSDARIVLTATAEDKYVERYWEMYKPKATAASLKRLRPALIATPNFSMHADTVRHDNLISMARIAACYEDFASAGLPTALHVNGRTPRDFERWADYLNASPWVSAIAYEMATMGGSSVRRTWHAEQLVLLSERVKKPLTLFIRGGIEHLATLSSKFDRVVWTDASAQMKAKMRQAASSSHGRLTWAASPTNPGDPVDKLFLHNIRVYQRVACVFLPTIERPTPRSQIKQRSVDELPVLFAP